MSTIPTIRYGDLSNARKAYYEDGCLIVKGVISQKKITEILFFVQKLVKLRFPELTVSRGNVYEETSELIMLAIKKDMSFQQSLYDILWKSDIMHKLSTCDEICSIVKRILSPIISHHYKKLLLIGLPYEQWHLARWHQDTYYNGIPEDACTIYAPLQNTDRKNGGLTLALKSHKNGLQKHSHNLKNTKWNTIDFEKIKKNHCLVSISMKPGDVLFMHGLLAHSANENQSKAVRLVANFRYQNLKNKTFVDQNWKSGDLSEARNALMRQE